MVLTSLHGRCGAICLRQEYILEHYALFYPSSFFWIISTFVPLPLSISGYLHGLVHNLRLFAPSFLHHGAIMATLDPEEIGVQLPEQFLLSVLMQRVPSESTWLDEQWEAMGVSVVSEAVAISASSPAMVHEKAGVRRYLYTGFPLTLHPDECESYYHNLITPSPRCFVVAEPDEAGVPVPFLVTLSFDEAHAYLEGDEIVYAVDIPPELYRWTESYVLAHYVPQKKSKRKLDNWKEQGRGEHPV